jgi:hypothetical protein
MRITVQTTTAPPSVGGAATSEPPGLRELAAELSVAFRALHPGTSDPSLGRFFTVEVPDAAEAQRVVAVLRRSPAIAAAYVKPPDEVP